MFASRKITLLGSAIIWSVFIGILCLVAAAKFIYVVDRAYVSQEIITVSQDMDNSLINMAAGERAYILTGDASYLKPYQEYYNTLLSLSGQLTSLSTTQGGLYGIDINSLAALDYQKVMSVSDLEAFRTKVGLETAAKEFADTNSEVSQDELHAVVLSIQTEQIALMSKQSRQARVYALMVIGGIIWLFACLITDIVIFNRDYKELRLQATKS
jgi:CHASE3 domain sensor protein